MTEIIKYQTSFTVRTESGEYSSNLVITAVGRIPNIENLGLEERGIRATSRGIEINEYMQTSDPSVFAIGDCASTKQLAPISDMEAKIAAENILEVHSTTASYDAIRSVVFTHPQLASVGLAPSEAKELGAEVTVGSGDGSRWGNYRRLNSSLVRYCTISDASSGRILGAHLLSPYAGEQINLFALAIRHGLTGSEIADLPWAYPTYTSDIKYMI